MAPLTDWQKALLTIAEERKVLLFGQFKLKSHRMSPYFFNAGNFADGEGFQQLCMAYAHTIHQSNLSFDLLFGLAYKGIPLVAGTALLLFEKFGFSFPFCYNRKEFKDHGEKGSIVGASEMLKAGTRVLVLDDVLTAGTALSESLKLLKSRNCVISGVIIALDREEYTDLLDTETKLSTIEAFSQQYQFPIIPVLTLTDILQYLKTKVTEENDFYDKIIKSISKYKSKYCIKSFANGTNT